MSARSLVARAALALLGLLIGVNAATAQLGTTPLFFGYSTRPAAVAYLDGPSMLPAGPALAPATDTDAVAWFTAVTTNGGTVSNYQKSAVATLITALKTAGAWANLDDGWLLVAENSVQALTSLKARRLATAVNAPLFAPALGYSFDGATNYVDTGYLASTMAVNVTATNTRIAGYERVNVTGATAAANGSMLGISQSASRSWRLTPASAPNNNTGSLLEVQELGSTFIANPPAESRGLSVVSRNGDGTTVLGFHDGVQLVRTADPTSLASLVPSISLFLGGRNSGGSLFSARPTVLGWASVGGALTPAQELPAFNAITAYMAAWGASVP